MTHQFFIVSLQVTFTMGVKEGNCTRRKSCLSFRDFYPTLESVCTPLGLSGRYGLVTAGVTQNQASQLPETAKTATFEKIVINRLTSLKP